MFDHVGIHVADLGASIRFYRGALESLGHVLCSQSDTDASFGPPGHAGLFLYAGKAGAGSHLAFTASERGAVDAFHAAGLRAGGRDNGKPGLRLDYAPDYYGAFLIDPDGNNVEAVCLTRENHHG